MTIDLERKPDFENESLRMWAEDNKVKKDAVISDAVDNGFKVSYKDLTLTCCGFTKVTDRKNDRLILAYKINHNKVLLWYLSPDISKEEKEKAQMAIDIIIKTTGIEAKDMMDVIKEIYNEKHIMMDKKILKDADADAEAKE